MSTHVTHIRTGFPSIDAALGGGLRRGDLALLAGEDGVGKSALALAIALRVSEAGVPAAVLSGEMTEQRLFERLVAMEARVRVEELHAEGTAEAVRERIEETRRTLAARAPTLGTLPSGDLDEVDRIANGRTVAGVVHANPIEWLASDAPTTLRVPPLLVVVDPVEWLVSGARTLEEELATVAQRLKEVAMRHEIVVLATTGLPGLPRDAGDRRPALDDLGGRGALRQHADAVLALYREALRDSTAAEGATELLVLKNRNGARGYVDLYFYERWMRFEDMVEPDR